MTVIDFDPVIRDKCAQHLTNGQKVMYGCLCHHYGTKKPPLVFSYQETQGRLLSSHLYYITVSP